MTPHRKREPRPPPPARAAAAAPRPPRQGERRDTGGGGRRAAPARTAGTRCACAAPRAGRGGKRRGEGRKGGRGRAAPAPQRGRAGGAERPRRMRRPPGAGLREGRGSGRQPGPGLRRSLLSVPRSGVLYPEAGGTRQVSALAPECPGSSRGGVAGPRLPVAPEQPRRRSGSRSPVPPALVAAGMSAARAAGDRNGLGGGGRLGAASYGGSSGFHNRGVGRRSCLTRRRSRGYSQKGPDEAARLLSQREQRRLCVRLHAGKLARGCFPLALPCVSIYRHLPCRARERGRGKKTLPS